MKAIYQITNDKNGKIYIGSSKNLRQRWNRHKNLLNKGEHYNPHLQNAWDKNGGENFTFTVLEEVEKDEDLIPAEQRWLDGSRSYERSIGYNILRAADSPLGITRSAETKRKMATSQKARTDGGIPGTARLTWEKVRHMRTLHEQEGIGGTELAFRFGISPSAARSIIKRRSWKRDPEETA